MTHTASAGGNTLDMVLTVIVHSMNRAKNDSISEVEASQRPAKGHHSASSSAAVKHSSEQTETQGAAQKGEQNDRQKGE
jgi:hypothetical protein